MLSHGSARITVDRYSHLSDDDLETLTDNMDARYGAAQVRAKADPGDVIDLNMKREKAP